MTGEAEIDTRQLAPVGGITPRSGAEWRSDLFVGGFLALVAFALYLMPMLLGRPLSETPEARVAVAAREMIVSGNYTVPTIGGGARYNKPPLPYWLAAGTAKMLDSEAGPSKPPSRETMMRAVQLPSALAVAFAVFVASFYACIVFGRAAGLFAGLMLGLCFMSAHYAWLGYGDTTLMAACTALFCSAAWLVTAPQPGFITCVVFGVSLGLAILSKGHIPVLLLAGPVLLEVLLRRSFNGRKVLLFVLGLVIAGAISVPWFVTINNLQGAGDVMKAEVLDALSPTAHAQSDRLGYYFYKLAGGLLPWVPVLVFGWLYYFVHKPQQADADEPRQMQLLARENFRFFVISSVLGFIGFYAVGKQQDHYLLPILPLLSLASSYVLSRFRSPGGRAEEALAWSQIVIGAIGGIAIATLPLWIEAVGLFNENKAVLDAFLESTGLAVTVPVGLVFLVLHMFIARQWVEGRVMTASLVIGAAAYSGLFAWSIHWTTRTQNDTHLYVESEILKEELGKMGNVKIYGAGTPDAMMTFYLEQPVRDFLRDLSTEPAAGENPPQRVLVVSRNDVKALDRKYELGLEQYARPGEETYVAIPLPGDVDWPEKIRSVYKKK